MIQQLFALANWREILIGDRVTDADINSITTFTIDLMDDQRQAQGEAEMAGELKDAAILAMKIDRNHRRLRHLDQLGDKEFPFQIDGMTKGAMHGGCNPTGGEDNDCIASLQSCQRVLFGRNVKLGGRLGFAKIDGQHKTRNPWFLTERVVDQNFEVGADLGCQMADD